MLPEAFANLILSGFFYLAAGFLYISAFLNAGPRSERFAYLFIRCGFVCATVYLAFEAWSHGFAFPILNFAHVLAFFGWALAFVYLIPLGRKETQSFGLILAPVLFILTLAALLNASAPIYKFDVHIYFALHIIFAFFAYASFTLSFSAALLYLIQHYELKRRHPGTFYHKLPNLEVLDQMIYQPMIFGTVLLVCAVVVGMLWSHDVYGQIWLQDPKTMLTFLIMGLYGFILSLRFASAIRPSRLAILVLVVFGLMISSFIGGRHLNGVHSINSSSGLSLSASAPEAQPASRPTAGVDV